MNLHSLAFRETQFDVVDRQGQPWLKSSQISSAIGYKDDKSIHRIYARHSDEFTDKMTGVVKVTTPSGDQEMRIFSLRGAHLIGMFARTKEAADFREWVLDVLEGKALAANATKSLESPTLTASEQQTLSEIVATRSSECTDIGKAKAEIWSRIHRKFRIARYQQLPREQLSVAITYVMQMDLKTESVPEMPVPEKAAYREIADYTYAREQMSSLYDWSRRALPPRVQDEVYDVLKELDRSLVRGWTEIDESIICLIKAMGMLRRWKRAH